jgi:diguanylate cyclase (GGDEF)-like protein/PAS domain S-box-containing protein
MTKFPHLIKSAPQLANPPVQYYILTLQILGFAAAYFVTGKLGTYLAIPPGYATAIWPPSGIALAGILLFGFRAWPGILLGSILVNYSTSFAGGTVSEIIISSTITFAIAGGAALQAVTGAYLLRRFSGFPNLLATEKEVFSFMFFGGVVSTLINASIAVTTLVVAGRIPLSNAFVNWWTWWAGDAVGIFIFTPLVLVWTLPPAEQWRNRRIAISLTIFITFVFTAALANYASQQEKHTLKFEFEKDSAVLSATLEKSILLHLNVLHSIESFYSASNSVNKAEFKAFTEDMLNKLNGIQALSWNPYVLSSERVAFERTMREQLGPGFKIYEHDSAKQVISAGSRAAYVPVSFIEPLKGNESALGYDVYSDEVRREAMNRARDTGGIVTTPRITLVQDHGSQFGVLAFMAIYRNGAKTTTISERRQNIKGYAVAVFRGGDIVVDALKNTHVNNLAYKLIDTSATAAEQLLFSTHSTTDNKGLSALTSQEKGLFGSALKLKRQTNINVGGRNWLFEVTPTERFVAEHRTDTAWYILLVGFLLTGITGVIVLLSTGREDVLRKLVDARASDLRKSYEQLYKLSEQVPGAIYQFKLSADGHFSFPYVSEGIRQIYEVTPEQVRDDAGLVFAIIHPDDYEAIVASIQESARDIKPWQLEYRVNLPKQGVQWLHGQAHPEKLADGSVLWHGFINNITERKQAEAIFHGVFDQSSFLAGVLDAHGCLINVNKTALSFTSVSYEDVIGKYFPDTPWWSNPDDRAQLIEALKYAYAGKSSSFEATHATADGGHINVLFSATPIILENVIYVSVAGVDITQRKSLEARLRMLSTAIEQSPTSVAIANLDAEIEYVNPRFTQVTGYSAAEVVGKNPRVLQSGVTDQAVYNDMWANLTQGLPWIGEFVNKRKNGEIYYEEAYISPVKGDDGKVSHYVAVKLDVSARKQAEDALRIAAIAFESQEGMMVTDANSNILRVNSAFTVITGYTSEEAVGQTPHLLSSGRQNEAFYEEMWERLNETGTWQGEIWNRRKNGEIYPEQLNITAVKDTTGRVTNYVATLTDVTMSKIASEAIKTLAFYDPLTKIPNRRLLVDRLNQTMAASRRNKTYGALMFLDLDNFKPLNDIHGHVVGDMLLIEAANRLTNCIRKTDTVARFGGDEFIVILAELDADKAISITRAASVAEKIRAALSEPYVFTINHEAEADTTVEHHCTASIGIVMFIDHESSQDDIMRWADAAMYEAKDAGRNQIRFYSENT